MNINSISGGSPESGRTSLSSHDSQAAKVDLPGSRQRPVQPRRSTLLPVGPEGAIPPTTQLPKRETASHDQPNPAPASQGTEQQNQKSERTETPSHAPKVNTRHGQKRAGQLFEELSASRKRQQQKVRRLAKENAQYKMPYLDPVSEFNATMIAKLFPSEVKSFLLQWEGGIEKYNQYLRMSPEEQARADEARRSARRREKAMVHRKRMQDKRAHRAMQQQNSPEQLTKQPVQPFSEVRERLKMSVEGSRRRREMKKAAQKDEIFREETARTVAMQLQNNQELLQQTIEKVSELAQSRIFNDQLAISILALLFSEEPEAGLVIAQALSLAEPNEAYERYVASPIARHVKRYVREATQLADTDENQSALDVLGGTLASILAKHMENPANPDLQHRVPYGARIMAETLFEMQNPKYQDVLRLHVLREFVSHGRDLNNREFQKTYVNYQAAYGDIIDFDQFATVKK